MNPLVEITLKEMQHDSDWCCVFADEGNYSDGNCDKDVVSPDGANMEPFTRMDVEKIVALVADEDDQANVSDWLGVFLLRDGRYLAATGNCCYTGWDCQGGNTLTVAKTLEAVVQYGLTPGQAAWLRLEHPGIDTEEG